MLNTLKTHEIVRKGVISRIVDNTTQWKGEQLYPMSNILVQDNTLVFVDGSNPYILTEKIGFIATQPARFSIITVDNGFCLNIIQGVMVVNNNKETYIVNEKGNIGVLQEHMSIEWFDVKRYHGIVTQPVKNRYGLVKKKVDDYINNLVITLEMYFTVEKLPLLSARYKDTPSYTSTFQTKIVDISETIGLGLFNYVNEQDYETARKENEAKVREENIAKIMLLREEEIARKLQEKEASGKGKGTKRAPKQETTKTIEKANDWLTVMRGGN